MRRGRALVGLALALVLALAPALARADFKWGERFQHQAHADQMQAKGKQTPACRACHQLD